ncbi:DUF1150 family protein [Gluconacetobacter azotocaptans]|uniref:DUF1150 family protein n=3 Tax=Gluconacetobacter TaxID=89583 RepID=A0A7W4J4H3_9PROT|nr:MULTISPECIES: DUF1150 family protein [Gluconacetobacter]MBB2174496.1 DUF1150 family protein [Gluconacetobacter johannae]MBB2189726.1 DUF1150 family protein [Gluconacetobacter azotocaptans]MBB2201195.1 DUF1150 family protein [Gluconacetobacter tumulisoli]MBM9401327.1 DUF1150 family protein [Gluconacetobacter azotocaptans]GBQ29931.1 hypothetical protein AA13594_1541 [Gluconacetobacter azotocaptans DSM 13594]
MRITTQNGRVVLQPDQAQLPGDVRHLTDTQLLSLGVSRVAYIKAVVIEGQDVFAIHAADGTPMALTDDQDTAIEAILQHEMVPALVH